MRNITRILSPIDFSHFPDPCGAVEVANRGDAALFYEKSVPAKHIFLHADRLGREEILAARGQCRFLVSSADALYSLDSALDGTLPAGYLEPVGLCIGPDGFGRDIPTLSSTMRRTKNLTLRYAFVSLDSAEGLPSAAREAFSFVKRLRADVPCMLHGFCLKGLLKPLTAGNEALADTLKMLSALNDSSLYAEFFIA